MRRGILLAGAQLAMALSLTGCAARATYVSGYATMPPPPPRVEVFGVAPGPDFVWIQGFWNRGGGNYAWIPGRWERPPHPHARWETSRWERRGGRYCYRQGRWR